MIPDVVQALLNDPRLDDLGRGIAVRPLTGPGRESQSPIIFVLTGIRSHSRLQSPLRSPCTQPVTPEKTWCSADDS